MNPSKTYLARLITNPKIFGQYAARLSAEFFTDPLDSALYGAFSADFDASPDVSVLNVLKRLKSEKKVQIADVVKLYQEPQTTATVPTCQIIDQLIEDYQKFRGDEVTRLYQSGAISNQQLIAEMEDIDLLGGSPERPGISEFSKEATEQMRQRVDAFRRGVDLPGVLYCGIPTIDQHQTFELGKNVGIGARPGMGKSTLARTIAVNFAKRGVPVLMFSLEMSGKQITNLMTCAEANIDSLTWRNGSLRDSQIREYEEAAERIKKLPIQIETLGDLADFRATVHEWARNGGEGRGVVITDYTQQMSDKGTRHSRKDLELGAISNAMLMLMQRYNYCNIPIFQLNRSVETRGGDKRPMLADLRESGSFEQDLNICMLLYRPIAYGFETTEDGESTHEICEVIYAKNREGHTGTEILRADLALGKFTDWKEQQEEGVIKIPSRKTDSDTVPF